MESSPYSERAINIMKVGKKKVTAKARGASEERYRLFVEG